MKFADLHLHTIFSDGTYTAEELISEVVKSGINTVAITDHDTVEGIVPCLKAAGEKDIEVIPAIELTAEHDGLEIHILGYFIDYRNGDLREKLNFLKANRRERMHKMVDKLKKMNVAIEADEVFELAAGAPAGRLHLARVLVKSGYVRSIYDAFHKYIGDQAPAYICGFRLKPSESIELIRSNGGIPVLAHPYSMKRDDLIPLFVDYGIRGLEVYYPEHTKTMTQHYKDIADKYGLLITGGSDCHGSVKPDVQLGAIKLPYSFVEKLKQEKTKMR